VWKVASIAAAPNALRGEINDARLAPCDDAMTDCAKAGAGFAKKACSNRRFA
jgi:hypothetical protein